MTESNRVYVALNYIWSWTHYIVSVVVVETEKKVSSSNVENGEISEDIKRLLNIEENRGKNDRYLKELDLLLRCIERMSGNSFRIKRWLSAALILFLGIIGREGVINAVTCGSIVTIIVLLWVMDAYYMSLERIYRNRYRKIRANGDDLSIYENIIDNNLFELNPKYIDEDGTIGHGERFGSYIDRYLLFSIFSTTNVALYSSSIAIIVIVTVNVLMPENLIYMLIGSAAFILTLLLVSHLLHSVRYDEKKQWWHKV